MAEKAAIKLRMKSIAETKKITDAMYMTSSVKMRRARSGVDKTKPYFNALREEIGSLLHYLPANEHPYFRVGNSAASRAAMLVITSDTGLAGSYNHTVIKEAEKLLRAQPDLQLFVIGEYGRQFFISHKRPLRESFLYSSEMPTIREAQKICAELLRDYDAGEFERIDILYTDYHSGRAGECRRIRLLPLSEAQFYYSDTEEALFGKEFLPDPTRLITEIIPSYLTGYIYGALVDSYCNEQESRMKAMQSAGENAEEMLRRLRLHYNSLRQAEITEEISEISSGAKALRRKSQAVDNGSAAGRKEPNMDLQTPNNNSRAEIAGISGPIVDVRFPEDAALPKIREKLTVNTADGRWERVCRTGRRDSGFHQE